MRNERAQSKSWGLFCLAPLPLRQPSKRPGISVDKDGAFRLKSGPAPCVALASISYRWMYPGHYGLGPHLNKGMSMQVRCKVYGFTNASSGIECTVERDRLEVGECLQHNEQEYLIVSVVESQGCWFANVIPEYQRHFMRRPLPAPRRQERPEALSSDTAADWRQRAEQAEHHLQTLREEQMLCGERLEHLMQMLEHLTKEPDTPQHEPQHLLSGYRGGKHVH